MSGGLRALLSGIVDYAGLFPPAGLDMPTSVENYARYRDGDHAWMLGRFVVPVSRFDEFLDDARPYLRSAADPWRASAIVGGDVEGDLARVAAFNQANGGALVDAVEVKAGDPAAVETIARALPGGVRAFVEVAAASDPEPMIRALAEARTGSRVRLRAKIRTGGVTPEAIPAVEDVARFIRRCYASDVAFKATAGLHHPVRAEQALSYEDGAPRSVMHGFLNVFLTAVFCFNGLGAVDAPRLLSLQSADEWHFDDGGVAWEDYRMSVAEIERVRRRFAISFGSCSFEEPVVDLRHLGLLE